MCESAGPGDPAGGSGEEEAVRAAPDPPFLQTIVAMVASFFCETAGKLRTLIGSIVPERPRSSADPFQP